MQITHIAGYKFIPLAELTELRVSLLDRCTDLALKGTILLSPEGVNISLSGSHAAIQAIKTYLYQDARFTDMTFRESLAAVQPFKRMKVKLKKEIISFRQSEVRPTEVRAPSISPSDLKQWLDEKRDVTLLDTRNDYEVQYGTFENAAHFGLNDFCEFPTVAEKLNPEKPIVMFCTGGVRCEKAALYLLNSGFSEVYQLDGGILNYFSEVGGAHYQGNCFVFDERVALDSQLQTASDS